jgi:hypothetical protein
MTAARHTFVADAQPTQVGLGRGRRVFTGERADPNAWRPRTGDLQADRMALPDYANDAAGIVGMGQCHNPATMRPCCAFWRECQKETIAGVNVVCRVQLGEDAERIQDAARRAAAAALDERMLAVIRDAAAPLLFAEIRAALGIDGAADYDMARGALLRLHHSRRIVAMGQRLRKSGRSYKPAKLWAIKED